MSERLEIMHQHLSGLHALYGDEAGTRIARKHIGWYLEYFAQARSLRQTFNRLESSTAQYEFLARLASTELLATSEPQELAA